MLDAAEHLDLTRRPPTDEEAARAAAAAAVLVRARGADDAVVVRGGQDGEPLPLPPAVADLVAQLLGHLARGEMVALHPVGAMLTTRQAADLLGVSRPYLTRLLKGGAIPHSMVGSHHRVRLEDLLAYKARRDAEREAALDELAALGQAFDGEA